MTDNYFLAGDIGGTKTTLAIFSPAAGLRAPLTERTFRSAAFPNLAAIVREFLAQATISVRRAYFGVAGPVVLGKAAVTNLSWHISERELVAAFHFEQVTLLNDLVAIANAVPVLQANDLHTLNAGSPVPGGAMAVVAPGTGLGEAYLTWDGQAYHAYASEGGHTDFAPTDAQEMALLRYLQKKFGRVSYERICSGIGLPNIYAFLKDIGFAPEPDWLAAELAAVPDPNPILVRYALENPAKCPLCTETLRLFVSVLGAEAGNMALKVLASGGVYLGGGIPPRILPLLASETFMHPFANKGRFADMLRRFPVHVILNRRAALLGAARYGLREMQ